MWSGMKNNFIYMLIFWVLDVVVTDKARQTYVFHKKIYIIEHTHTYNITHERSYMLDKLN